jgi:hypothetical protein
MTNLREIIYPPFRIVYRPTSSATRLLSSRPLLKANSPSSGARITPTSNLPPNRHERTATWSAENPAGRWRSYDYADLMARDKASLDIFWLRDESLENSDNLPEPGVIARDMIFDLETALEQLRLIAVDVGEEDTV